MEMSRVPAWHISEGAMPCSYCLVSCPIVQRPARIISLKKKKIFFLIYKMYNLLFLCFQTADVKMFVTACRFVPMFSPTAHKIVPRAQDLVSFARWIVHA